MSEELTWEAIDLERRYGPYKYPLAARIERHLEAVANSHEWHRGRSPWGPPVAPPTLLGNMTMRFLDEAGPVPPGTLHAKSQIAIGAALRLDRQPVAYGRFTEKYVKRGRRWFTFEARWRDETGLILGRASVTMVLPGREDAPEGEEEERSAQEGREPPPGKPEGAGDQTRLAPITRTLTPELVAQYSEDSANALRGQSIHVHEEFARRAGFPATVAQGLMIADYMGEMMEYALGREWYENSRLSVAFLRPVLAGDTVTVEGRLAASVEEGAVVRREYELWAANQRAEVTAAGRASALVRRPSVTPIR